MWGGVANMLARALSVLMLWTGDERVDLGVVSAQTPQQQTTVDGHGGGQQQQH